MWEGGNLLPSLLTFFKKRSLPSPRARPLSTSGGEEGEGRGVPQKDAEKGPERRRGGGIRKEEGRPEGERRIFLLKNFSSFYK